MSKLTSLTVVLAASAAALAAPAAKAEDIKLRIASGHAVRDALRQPDADVLRARGDQARQGAKTKHTVEFIEGYGGAMVKVVRHARGRAGGHHRRRRLLLLLRALEPAAARLPGDAAVRHDERRHEPARSRAPSTTRSPYMSKVFEDKFGQKHARHHRRQRLQPADELRLEQRLRVSRARRSAAPASTSNGWSSAARSRCRRRRPRSTRRCRPASYSGVIIFPSFIVNLKWYEVAKTLHAGRLRRHQPGMALTINKATFPSCRKRCRTSSSRSAVNTRPGLARSTRRTIPSSSSSSRGFGVERQAGAGQRQARLGQVARQLAAGARHRARQGRPAGQPGIQPGTREAEKLGHKWPVRYDDQGGHRRSQEVMRDPGRSPSGSGRSALEYRSSGVRAAVGGKRRSGLPGMGGLFEERSETGRNACRHSIESSTGWVSRCW